MSTKRVILSALLTLLSAGYAQGRNVAASAHEVHPLLIGAAVPDTRLETADGKVFRLRQEVKDKPTVIIFYRGGWCPFCNRHLAGLQKIESRLVNLGYQILAISPDRPAKLTASSEAARISYTLLSDRKMKAAQAFGIAFKLNQPTLKMLANYNIDIEDASGEIHHQLPVPAVFVVGKDGKIGFTYVNPDYKVRLDGDVMLAAAKAVLKQ